MSAEGYVHLENVDIQKEADSAFLVVLEGRVTIAGQTAGPRDTFRIEGKTDGADVAAAAAALIRITPLRAR